VKDLETLRAELEKFADERDWKRYHTPKNLALALAGEVGELGALFQWLTPEESIVRPHEDEAVRRAVSDEVADILIYLVRLADVLEIDLLAVAEEKIAVNRRRWPAGEGPAAFGDNVVPPTEADL
jgi:NTP pyrophosphatase (non-canonical NTP hydrolase)